MAEILTHTFVSTKSESSDNSLVSVAEWNDGHTFVGGINGQVLIYDNTQSKNIRWTDGPKLLTSTAAIANPTTSPITGAAPITHDPNTNIISGLTLRVLATTVGAVVYDAEIKVNSLTLVSATGIASGKSATLYRFSEYDNTSRTYDVTLTSSGGANFTGGTIELDLFIIGR